MIVKNEEHHLPRCLDTVRGLVDEIIIVDTGSTDHTVEIAKEYTAQVYYFQWQDNFSAARNFAFSKANMEYCMWLDADDVIEPDDQEKFRALKATLSSDTDVVMMRYHTAFGSDGLPTFTYDRERLIRRGAGMQWQGAVHEAIAPFGHIVYSEAAISHRKDGPGDPERNLRIFEKLRSSGREFSPREQFYYARELTYHGCDKEAAEWFETFLNGGKGWVEDNREACQNLAQCYVRLGKPEKAFSTLVRALRYGAPRAELCCDLGAFFFEHTDYPSAVFWYECALAADSNTSRNGGFTQPDCHGYLPAMQLCLCYYRLGDPVRSAQYNELAGALKPDSPAYAYNRKFFESIGISGNISEAVS